MTRILPETSRDDLKVRSEGVRSSEQDAPALNDAHDTGLRH